MPFGLAGGLAAGVASSAIGAGISALTAGSQSDAISKGQAQANAALAPFENTGTLAEAQTANLLGLNGQDAANTAMSSFQAAPGYQYDVQQGLKAVDAGAAAKGTLTSGSTLKAEQTLGNNLADQGFQTYIGNLNALTGYGANAAAGVASTDTSAAGQQASIYGNEGKNISSAIGGGLTNGLTAYGTGGTAANGGGGFTDNGLMDA